MAYGDNGGGNFAGTGGYGGNFGGVGGAKGGYGGGYGGSAGYGTGSANRKVNNPGGGFSPSNNGAGGAKSANSGRTASADLNRMPRKTTTQTVGMNVTNLGPPSTNVQTVDPLQQEIYNMPEYQSIATKLPKRTPSQGGGTTGGGNNSSIGGGQHGLGNSGGVGGWARGGVIQPGEHGWVGERGPEYAFGLPNGGVQITPNHMIGRLIGALNGRR